MKIYSIGCSWNHRLAPALRDLGYEVAGSEESRIRKGNIAWSDGLAGFGLTHIETIINKELETIKNNDILLVQLPTPVRSVLKDSLPLQNTSSYINDFERLKKLVGKENANIEVLEDYKNHLISISKLHKRVIFLIFNVGGYPFRHPCDFGKECESNIIEFIKQQNFEFVYRTFESQRGYSVNEIEVSELQKKELIESVKTQKTHTESYKSIYSHCIHPNETFIIDAHPNELSASIFANDISKYLKKQL
jgi:hypothetical protein